MQNLFSGNPTDPSLIQLYKQQPETCPYIPTEEAENLIFFAEQEQLSEKQLNDWVSAGWRHFGATFFRPMCSKCDKCKSVRIDLAKFNQSRSQKRVWKRGQNYTAALRDVQLQKEHLDLINSWQQNRHERHQWDLQYFGVSEAKNSFFTLQGVSQQLELRDASARLVALSFLDLTKDFCNAIYTVYSPGFARWSPGTLMILHMVETCRNQAVPYLYLGLWNAEATSLAYKSRFAGLEILDGTSGWRGF